MGNVIREVEILRKKTRNIREQKHCDGNEEYSQWTYSREGSAEERITELEDMTRKISKTENKSKIIEKQKQNKEKKL
jgi:hypothetical protein